MICPHCKMPVKVAMSIVGPDRWYCPKCVLSGEVGKPPETIIEPIKELKK